MVTVVVTAVVVTALVAAVVADTAVDWATAGELALVWEEVVVVAALGLVVAWPLVVVVVVEEHLDLTLDTV